MDAIDRRNHRWIFQILSGKKPEDTDKTPHFLETKIQELYSCIESINVGEGLTQTGIEKMLFANYYVGYNAYFHIMRHYSRNNKVRIYYQKNSRMQICAKQGKGIIKIWIPAEEEGFD